MGHTKMAPGKRARYSAHQKVNINPAPDTITSENLDELHPGAVERHKAETQPASWKSGRSIDDSSNKMLMAPVSSDDDQSDGEEEADAGPTFEEEQKEFHEELSHLTFAQLQALKDKLGTRAYKQAVFGVPEQRKKRRRKQSEFVRESKSMPVELPSKKRVTSYRKICEYTKPRPRDPRYDFQCGKFNKEEFEDNYSFLKELRTKEQMLMKKQLHKEKDEEKKQKIKVAVQRMANQDREEDKRKKRADAERLERISQAERVKEGKKPFFLKKSIKRKLELAEKFEKLKKAGQLDKYMQKRRKKVAAGERKSLYNNVRK